MPSEISLPKVVLLGRPNVGKSTLFNRLIRSNRAITHDRPGVTRDRMEGVVHSYAGGDFALVDTGGITLDSHHAVSEGPEGIRGFEAEILRQAEEALQEAALVCMVVDGRDGLMPFDEHLASYLRRSGKPVLLVVNKVDGAEKEDILSAEFHGLGFPMLACSAEHGFNLRGLEEEICDLLPDQEGAENQPAAQEETLEEDHDKPGIRRRKAADNLRLCLLGRPNAGKSSMANAFLGKERMIVSGVAGTTRDSVDLALEKNGKKYTLVDTAGVRRRSRIVDAVERFSVNSSIKSTTKADVTFLLLDVSEGLTAQDKKLVELLDERKTPFLIVLNKIDLVPAKKRAEILKDLKEELSFCGHVPVVPASAMTGEGLDRLIPLAERIYAECGTRVSTGLLNRAMEETLARHQAPVVRRVRPKFFYLTQAESEPPTFVC
ncbi:MAG: ribosome biogenesis GTPase Der, partial [Mailhella sp.]|nr:ribosome biogenesis GTPase Der [Mailhella sp.]